jgi:hypothetical protein
LKLFNGLEDVKVISYYKSKDMEIDILDVGNIVIESRDFIGFEI